MSLATFRRRVSLTTSDAMDEDPSISCAHIHVPCGSTSPLTSQHAFAVPEHKKGGSYNYMTYTMFDQVFWRAISGQVNRFRRKVLNIEPTNFDKLEQHKSESLTILHGSGCMLKSRSSVSVQLLA